MAKSLNDLQNNYYYWRSGWRQLISFILPFLIAVATIYFGYLEPIKRKEKEARFDEFISQLNSEYWALQEHAIEILSSEYGERGCKALRNFLSRAKNKNDKRLIDKILNSIPEDFCFGDIVLAQQFKEDLGLIPEEEFWIYIGNYNFKNDIWVSQSRMFGYDTTLSNISSFKPSDLTDKEFYVGVNKLNVREGPPYTQNGERVFPEQIDILKKGIKVKVKEIKMIEHPAASHVSRIWAKIDYK